MKRSGFLIFYFLYLYAISWWTANLACGEKCSKVGETPCVDFRKWWEKFLKQLMITWYSVIGVSGFFVVWGMWVEVSNEVGNRVVVTWVMGQWYTWVVDGLGWCELWCDGSVIYLGGGCGLLWWLDCLLWWVDCLAWFNF